MSLQRFDILINLLSSAVEILYMRQQDQQDNTAIAKKLEKRSGLVDYDKKKCVISEQTFKTVLFTVATHRL